MEYPFHVFLFYGMSFPCFFKSVCYAFAFPYIRRKSKHMAYTHEDYEKLKKAIVNGVQSVSYGDKSVNYRSMDDMEKALRIMEAELYPERTPRTRVLMNVDRGYFKK